MTRRRDLDMRRPRCKLLGFRQGAQPVGRRDSSDFGHGLNSAFQSVGHATSREGSCLTGGPPSRRASTDLQSSWPKPPAVLWQQEQALQLNNYSDPPVQRLAHMASGESEPIPEPGDWDPLYRQGRFVKQPDRYRSVHGLDSLTGLSLPGHAICLPRCICCRYLCFSF